MLRNVPKGLLMKIIISTHALFFFIILFLFPLEVYATKKNEQENAMEIIKTSICFGNSYEEFDRRTSQYDSSINKYASKYGISVALIKSVITAESCFNSKAVSPKGAQGLMQLMPATAKRFGVSDSFDTDQNIRGGTKYLRFLLKYFDDDLLNVIAAYNSGEGTVKKYKGIPPYKETREYVSKVSTLYRYYADNGVQEKKKRYDDFKRGDHPATFFVPRAMPKSRLITYKNYDKTAFKRKCHNRTSTRLKRSTKLSRTNGIWQRLYTVRKGDTLRLIELRTGINKHVLMAMNGLGARARLKKGRKILIWECRQ